MVAKAADASAASTAGKGGGTALSGPTAVELWSNDGGVIAELVIRYTQRPKLVNLGLLPPEPDAAGGGGYAKPRARKAAPPPTEVGDKKRNLGGGTSKDDCVDLS